MTFALTLFGIGVASSYGDLQKWEIIPFAVLALCAIAISWQAIRVVVRPTKKWQLPCNLERAEELITQPSNDDDPALSS